MGGFPALLALVGRYDMNGTMSSCFGRAARIANAMLHVKVCLWSAECPAISKPSTFSSVGTEQNIRVHFYDLVPLTVFH